MTSTNTDTRTIHSDTDFKLELVDATSAQGEHCEHCAMEDAYCIADVDITTEVCRFEGEYRDTHSVCWDCIPDVLRNHVGDEPAVVELAHNMQHSTTVNGHLPIAA